MTATTNTLVPNNWPSASYGEQITAFLAAERSSESGNDYTSLPYGPGGASGAYQFEPQTWQSAAAHVPGASQYPYAAAAPPQVQDAVAAYHANDLFKGYKNWYQTAEAWYYPAFADGPTGQHMGSVPPGNTLTMGQYATNVLAKMNILLSGRQLQPVPVPGAPDGSSGAQSVVSETCFIKIPPLPLVGGNWCLLGPGPARALAGAGLVAIGGLLLLSGAVIVVTTGLAGSPVARAVQPLADVTIAHRLRRPIPVEPSEEQRAAAREPRSRSGQEGAQEEAYRGGYQAGREAGRSESDPF